MSDDERLIELWDAFHMAYSESHNKPAIIEFLTALGTLMQPVRMVDEQQKP